MKDTERTAAMGVAGSGPALRSTSNVLGNVGARKTLSPNRLAFWGEYLVTMRPYLLPLSGLAGLAGMSLAHVQGAPRLGVVLCVFSFSYGFGQALTDCFQQDTDRLSAPYRPLVRGRIATHHVLSVSLAGLLVGVAILGWCNPWNLGVSSCAVAGLLAYTPAKRLWWGGPIVNAWVMALLPIMGWLIEPARSALVLTRHPEVLVVAAMTFAAYANFVLVGYLKDVRADRRARYNTLPVVFGWKRSALASDLWAVGALVTGIWAVALTADFARPHSLLAVAVLASGALLSAKTQIMLHGMRREDEAYRPLLNVVRVFLLLHVAVVASARPSWFPLATLFYLAFEFLVVQRPERRQI